MIAHSVARVLSEQSALDWQKCPTPTELPLSPGCPQRELLGSGPGGVALSSPVVSASGAFVGDELLLLHATTGASANTKHAPAPSSARTPLTSSLCPIAVDAVDLGEPGIESEPDAHLAREAKVLVGGIGPLAVGMDDIAG